MFYSLETQTETETFTISGTVQCSRLTTHRAGSPRPATQRRAGHDVVVVELLLAAGATASRSGPPSQSVAWSRCPRAQSTDDDDVCSDVD